MAYYNHPPHDTGHVPTPPTHLDPRALQGGSIFPPPPPHGILPNPALVGRQYAPSAPSAPQTNEYPPWQEPQLQEPEISEPVSINPSAIFSGPSPSFPPFSFQYQPRPSDPEPAPGPKQSATCDPEQDVKIDKEPALKKPQPVTAAKKEPPPPIDNIDESELLLSLADEYFDCAYDIGGNKLIEEDNELLQRYYKLFAAGLGCLEAALTRCKLKPEQEAALRLRYATILHEETNNFLEAEDALANGISLANRHKLYDLKYNMQHLNAQILFRNNKKAAMKFLGEVTRAAETHGHTAWVYAFKFLKASLHFKASHQNRAELNPAISILNSVISSSQKYGDSIVTALATTMEGYAHIVKANTPESLEHAQRSLAIARSLQMDQAVMNLPQVGVLIDIIDLFCSLQHYEPNQAQQKATSIAKSLASLRDNKAVREDGNFTVGVAKERMPNCSRSEGIVSLSEDGSLAITFAWPSKEELNRFGFLVSGLAYAHKNAGDGTKAEQMLREGIKAEASQKKSLLRPKSLIKAASDRLHQQHLTAFMHLYLGFLLCTRSEWKEAQQQLRYLESTPRSWSSKPVALDSLTAYLKGTLEQSQGALQPALSKYKRLLLTASDQHPRHMAPVEEEVSILATLNSLLIFRDSSGPNSSEQAVQLFELVAQRCPTHPNRQIQAAYHIVHASRSQTIMAMKQYLKAALTNAQMTQNNQMICMVLNLMCQRFFDRHVGDQAERSALASLNMAKQVGASIWLCLAYGVIGENLEAVGRGTEAERWFSDGVEVARKLPADVQRALGINFPTPA